VHGRAGEAAGLGEHGNRPGTATATAAVIGNVNRALTVGSDGARASNRSGVNDKDAAASRATAIDACRIAVGRVSRTVVGGARPAAAAHDESTRGAGEGGTAIPADDAGAVPAGATPAATAAVSPAAATPAEEAGAAPAEAPRAAPAAVSPAAAAAVLIVGGWMRIRRAAARITGSTARIAAVGIAFDTGIGEICERGVGHVTLGAG